jgi:hypothetical protein
MMAIFGAVRHIDLIIGTRVVLLHEGDLLFDAASPNVTLVTYLSAAEPGAGAPKPGPDVEIVPEADNPNVTGFRSVPSLRRDAICNSSAPSILWSSSLVHFVIGFSPY